MSRIAALLLPVSITLFVISTAVFHPHREDPMNHTAVFTEYAASDSWIAVHFVQWLSSLLLCGGLIAFSSSVPPKPGGGVPATVRFGFAGAVLTAAMFTMLQAVDGIALKWAVDAWMTAAAAERDALFAAAMALRWTEYALQSYSNCTLGLTLVLFGVGMMNAYPRWLGWMAVASGAAWIVHGIMVSTVGLFDSVPRLAAIILFSLWACALAFLLWRRSTSEPGVHAPAAP